MARRLISRVVATTAVTAALLIAAWFAYSWATGATLIVFRTGSMAPTMPQGSLAVTLPVAAEEIEVGDVVTVQRSESALPVTHRVVEVREGAQATTPGLGAAQRELLLKGDDNAEIDFEPYAVDRARRVVLAVPQLGNALMLLQSPLGMGLLTLLAGALTVWAFWPGGPRRDGAPLVDPPVDPPVDSPHGHARSSGRHRDAPVTAGMRP